MSYSRSVWFLSYLIKERLVHGVVHHELDELSKVYWIVLVFVKEGDHVSGLVLVTLVAQLHKDGLQVLCTDLSISVFVESHEDLNELFLCLVGLIECLDHENDKLVEVNLSIVVVIDLAN